LSFSPPHDCRITARCFRATFGFRIEPPYNFSSFRGEKSAIDTFFSRRENDPRGGEGGERIAKVRKRPVFSLHCRKCRGATWFDQGEAPQGIVWLLAMEPHDERHKGKKDAYDVFASLERGGDLYPASVDYKLVELARRIRDTENFGTDAPEDAKALLATVVRTTAIVSGTIAQVPVRLVVVESGDLARISIAVSALPVTGRLSGLQFELTDDRFRLLAESVRRAAADLFGDADAEAPTFSFPGGLRNERAFEVLTPKPSSRKRWK
jgi:hypothetical protein